MPDPALVAANVSTRDRPRGTAGALIAELGAVRQASAVALDLAVVPGIRAPASTGLAGLAGMLNGWILTAAAADRHQKNEVKQAFHVDFLRFVFVSR